MKEPKRRFFDFDLGLPTPTVIGAESVVIGDIRGAGQFVVSGEVHGDAEITGSLNLAVTGVWNGYIQAERAVVAGKITGGLKGAIIDGDIEVTSETPMLEFEEKRGK